jgi:hypothetical protein
MRVDYLGLLKKVGIKIETGDPILGDYPVLRTEFFDEGENITFPLTDVKMNDIQNIFSFLPYYEE